MPYFFTRTPPSFSHHYRLLMLALAAFALVALPALIDREENNATNVVQSQPSEPDKN